jgi:hypothetical protein
MKKKAKTKKLSIHAFGDWFGQGGDRKNDEPTTKGNL